MRRPAPYAAAAFLAALACAAAGAGRDDFLYGRAFLHEEDLPRAVWKGGETLERVHAAGGRAFSEARLALTLYNFKKGSIAASVSTNGTEWAPMQQVSGHGLHRMAVPARFFPCRTLRIRLEASPNASLRLARYQLAATAEGPPETVLPPRDPVSSNWFFRTDYGETLPGDSPEMRVWRADSGWRIPRRRPAPAAHAAELEIKTAANEAEAVQLVVSPRQDAADVRVACTAPLRAEGGAALPLSAVDILRVGYVPVRIPTDGSSVRADYPDPLPPQDGTPFPVAAGENQPFWVRVRPPAGTAPGIYRGELEVGSGRAKIRVPFAVEVFGFSLPAETACRSMIDIDVENIRRYHGLGDGAELREVFGKYLELFAAHRISPYNPAPFAKWKVRWRGDVPEFDWREWDAAMAEAMGRHGFNSFRMKVDGLGDGNSHAHRTRSIGGVREGDPRYAARMKAYLGGVERHLRERGWLEKAAVYWFDEPEEKDYPFVMEGFRILREAAPGLACVVTEEPVAGLMGGPGIWCSHTHRLHDHPGALQEARARGDRLWWYLCWLPKAPYATLFIDHPSVELRTWLWQTRREGLEGILVWQANHWHSTYLYGPSGSLQDPYIDPMSRHSYGKQFGNGDGVLVYPPKRPADAPVESIRLEMLRDGIEDFEYMAMLERRNPASPLLAVPGDVTESLVRFSISPVPIMRRREEIARELSGGVRP